MSKVKENPDVASLIRSYPERLNAALMELRSVIMDVATKNDRVGVLEETLKWGQPSYLTVGPKTGTTIRIDRDKSDDGDYALFVNCQSSLISEWRVMFPHLVFGGDRSVHFQVKEPLPEEEVRQMIGMALTYHVDRKGKATAARSRSTS